MGPQHSSEVPGASEDLPVPAASPPARPPGRSPAPGQPRSLLGSLAALVGVLASVVYILNPGFGVFELLPDNLPGIGNLDEAGATALLILGLRYLFRKPPQAS